MTPRTPRDERMEDLSRHANRLERLLLAVVWIAVGVMAILFLVGVFAGRAQSRDLGQWDKTDPVVQWYEKIMQPDVPTASCCGPSDSYWCDDIRVSTEGGKAHVYCKITDDRPDEPRGRPHRDIGTEYEIPQNKLKWGENDPQRGQGIELNPTGHAIIFLSRGDYVFCFVQNGGV